MDPTGLKAPHRRFLLLSLLLMLAGLGLAAWRVGSQSLWLDETYTWWFTGLGWDDLLQAARIDAVNPPLYYMFVKLFEPSGTEAALRLPSLLAQVGGIAGAIWLGFLVGGRLGGFAAGLFWATHPLTLWAARDARPYALSAALAVLAVALFVRLQRSWSNAVGGLAGVVLAVGLMTHYFFFVALASLVLLSAADLRRAPAFFRRWALVSLAAMIPLTFWLVWFLGTGSPSLGIGWIRAPVLADIPLTLWNLASGYGGRADVPSALLGLVVLISAGAGLVSSDRSLWRRLALAGILAPILAVWAVSQRRPVYVDRYFVILLPFVAALTAMGVSGLSRLARWRGLSDVARPTAAVAACLIALAAALTVHRGGKFDKEDWRGLAAFLQSRDVTSESLSLSEPEIALPLSYYFDRGMMSESSALIPACGDSCWWVLRQPYTATHALTQSVREPRRGQAPAIPASCQARDSWVSETGVSAIQVVCSR